jgi:hypothetical protein
MTIKVERLIAEVDYSNIEQICKKYKISNYTINLDGTVDVNGDVNLFNHKLSKIPLKFGRVTGNFNCQNNKLTKLENCPKEVGGSFYCHRNKLTTLEGCPVEVGGNFWCFNNKLTTLLGCPKEVGGSFWCYNNSLPQEIMDNPESFLKQINRDILINKLIDEY